MGESDGRAIFGGRVMFFVISFLATLRELGKNMASVLNLVLYYVLCAFAFLVSGSVGLGRV